MATNISSDWAVLIIVIAFLSLIVYGTIHGRLQAKKKEQAKEKDKS